MRLVPYSAQRSPKPLAKPLRSRPPSRSRIYTHQVAAHKSEPAKPTSQVAAQYKVAARPAAPGIIYGPNRLFIEKPHLRKVKYGKRRWVLV